MRLDEYLKITGKSLSEFAKEIDVSIQAASKYYNGLRVPRPNIMRRIVIVTGGSVTPNDFHDVSVTHDSTMPETG